MTPVPPNNRPLDIVPRFTPEEYDPEQVRRRRAWVEQRLGIALPLVGACAIPTIEMRGNIENAIGAAQVPLGIAGPLLVAGEHARGTYYVPLATTEGALVRSFERGMAMLTRAGGVSVRVFSDENVVCPLFPFDTVEDAHAFARSLPGHFESLRAEAESTTRHGRLLRVEARPAGRSVIALFVFHTGDAQGMNMIVRATERAAQWLVAAGLAPRFQIMSGLASEKRASGYLFGGAKGKKVVAGALVPADVVQTYLRASATEVFDVWRHSVIGHLQAHAAGCNAHLANGLAALFIACGQDVANLANAAVGITEYELTPEGDLFASVTLPSVTVATVGGGTALGTARECLQMMGCAGPGHAAALAEITAATALAGELSMAGAIAAGEFVSAHEAYGRNRPAGPEG
ncbi:MAG: hydroxymethylglutaryl-CoA reductase [Acidobacteriota bacterium]|nr:hydroxymethylglutaryl-CoA reductase [Acidobacteriota bacterium]